MEARDKLTATQEMQATQELPPREEWSIMQVIKYQRFEHPDNINLVDHFGVEKALERYSKNIKELEKLCEDKGIELRKVLSLVRERELSSLFESSDGNNYYVDTFFNYEGSLKLMKSGSKKAVLHLDGLCKESFDQSLYAINGESIFCVTDTGIILNEIPMEDVDSWHEERRRLEAELETLEGYKALFRYRFLNLVNPQLSEKEKALESRISDHSSNFPENPHDATKISMKKFHELTLALKTLLDKHNENLQEMQRRLSDFDLREFFAENSPTFDDEGGDIK